MRTHQLSGLDVGSVRTYKEDRMPVQFSESNATSLSSDRDAAGAGAPIEALTKESRLRHRRRSIIVAGVAILAALLTVGLTWTEFGSGSRTTQSDRHALGSSGSLLTQSSLEAKQICDRYTPSLATSGDAPTKLIHWTLTSPAAVSLGQTMLNRAVLGGISAQDEMTALPWNSPVSLCYFSGAFGPFDRPGPPTASSAGPTVYKAAGFVVTTSGQGFSVYLGRSANPNYGPALPAPASASSQVEAQQICAQYMPNVPMQDGPITLEQWYLLAPDQFGAFAAAWHATLDEPALNWPANSTVALCEFSGAFVTPGVPSGQLGPPPGHFNSSIDLVTNSGQGVML